jgi:alkanesulfonate monooxygenase SsuD/methylene tetrahydromethanopterin reductase-like flavin-dependent oxidoreductase (luciferase family)
VYDPILLANAVATLDQLSNGRFLFGITPGWDEFEVRNHRLDPARRWDVMRENVLAMRELWTTDDAEFHGRFLRLKWATWRVNVRRLVETPLV